MAIVDTPFLSAGASGSIGSTVIYSDYMGLAIVKGSYLTNWNGYYFDRSPPVSNTVDQQAIRSVFRDASDAWEVLPAFMQQEYNDLAKGQALTGRNLFIRDYIDEHYNP